MNEKELAKLIAKSVEDAVGTKMEAIKKEVEEAGKANAGIMKVAEIREKSVMNKKNIKAPFVQLGTEMEKFCEEMKEMIRGAKAAFNESTPADGGFTVPEELESSIISYVEENAIVRPRAFIKKMKGETWISNKLDQSVNAFGGVTVAWVGESESTDDTKFVLGQVSLTVHKMLMLTTESREILADSNIDFANYVVNIFGRAMVHFEDVAFLTGNGDGKPLGILVDEDIPVYNRSVANQIHPVDVDGMFYKIPLTLRKGAIWLGSTGAIQYLDGLVAGDGRKVYPQGNDGELKSLKGRQLIETEKCSELGTKGDLALVDFSWYYIGDREGITVDASAHVGFRNDDITVRLVKRVDGKMAMKEAAVILDVPEVY